ncbi:subtilisin family serine protease [Kibdelosporangium banguiense]|uniref:Subtilisin family serine protease n=1 Tax=Kibdelosporangium banguiense TaxID=1365924 RepID=A0ABS4TZL2_9PSEU|nr:subtilisin family serine protease [Kibdelosporangium banguiense]
MMLHPAAEFGALTQRVPMRVDHVYDTAIKGFSAWLSPSQLRKLAADKSVAAIEPDARVQALGEQLNPPSWGLDRIDQRRLPLDNRYRWITEASNVSAYVIDTGIRATHTDFGGRVGGGIDLVDDDGNPNDDNGHGTFIAGIIGGTRFGVAKKIQLVPVRVLNAQGSGTTADVIAGVDWVTRNARKPAVANMSIGGAANAALDAAVRNSIASGVTYGVAAGSSASDARNFSPARVAEALTTAATNINDCAHSASNYGPAIDMYAPGVNISGPWATSDTATTTLSGTSFSTPHVVGGAGLYLADHPTATPAQVAAALIAQSTKDVVCNVRPDTPNRLLYTLA